MRRFIIVLLVTIAVCLAGGALLLEPSSEPDGVPHPVRLTDAARGPGAGTATGNQGPPGSSLEGLAGAVTAHIERIGAYLTVVEVARVAALPAVEVEPALPDVSPSAAPSTAGTSVDWDAVAQCERGGDAGWNDNHGPAYEGRLGFAASSWDAYRDDSMPDNAGDATREQQIAVAERIREVNGGVVRGAWGCWEAGGVG